MTKSLDQLTIRSSHVFMSYSGIVVSQRVVVSVLDLEEDM